MKPQPRFYAVPKYQPEPITWVLDILIVGVAFGAALALYLS